MDTGHIGTRKRPLEQQDDGSSPSSKRKQQQEPALGKLSVLPEDLLLGRILPEAMVDDTFRQNFPQVCKSAASALFTVAQRMTTANMQHLFTHAQGATVLRTIDTLQTPMPYTPLQAISAHKFLRDLNVKSWYNAVENLVNAGMLNRAQNQLDIAIEAHPEAHQLRFRQAEIYELQGEFLNARNSYELVDRDCGAWDDAEHRKIALDALFVSEEAFRQGDWHTAIWQGRRVMLTSDRYPAAQEVVDRALARSPARASEEGMEVTLGVRLKSLEITRDLARAKSMLEDANEAIARNGGYPPLTVYSQLGQGKAICDQICLDRNNEIEARVLGEKISRVLETCYLSR